MTVRDGDPGSNSAFRQSSEPAGDNCAGGGLKIETGQDLNNNEVLDDDEVTATEYLCNGAEGSNGLESLIVQTDEPAGENCSHGGVKVQIGLDDNDDGALDDSEVDETRFVCNGDNASDGPLELVRLEDEAAGENCERGGVPCSRALTLTVMVASTMKK